MSLSVLLQQICIIFLMIATGFVAQRTRILNSENSKVLSEILMKIALPCMLLSSANLEGGTQQVGQMLIGFALLTACYIVTAAICNGLAHAMHLSPQKKAVFVVLTVLPNSAFIGIPLVTALFGPKAMLYGAAGVMAYNVFFFTYGVALFRKGQPFSFRVFVTPTNIATFIMVILLVTGLRLPPILADFTSTMGALTTPIALIIVGVMLGGSDLLAMLKNKFLYGMTLLRCFLFPLIFALALRFTPFDRELCLGLVILCACASGSLGAVLAKQTDSEPELASQAVAHSTVALMVSMPFVVWVAQFLLQ